jgi:hypothetical protein
VVLEAGVDGVQEGIDQVVQQGVLGSVVVVDGGLGDAQGAGQVGDRGAGKPAHAEPGQGQAGDAAVHPFVHAGHSLRSLTTGQ